MTTELVNPATEPATVQDYAARNAFCGNYGRHEGRKIPAVVRLTWPDGRFKPTYACAGCLKGSMYTVRDPGYGHPMLVSPCVETEEGKHYRESAAQRLHERLGYALSDPGSILPRAELHEDWTGTPAYESLSRWQKRAVLKVLEEEGRA